MEKAAEAVVEPKISNACRTIRPRWLKILKPKLRMTTPKKLISQSPAPSIAAFCTSQSLVDCLKWKGQWGHFPYQNTHEMLMQGLFWQQAPLHHCMPGQSSPSKQSGTFSKLST